MMRWVFFTLLFLFSNSFAYGQDDIDVPFSSRVTIDGKEYEGDVIAEAFAETALSSHVRISQEFPENYNRWENPHIPLRHRKSVFRPDRFKKEYPWLAEYVLREEGIPRYFAVNKWVQDIRISTGFPLDMEPFEDGKIPYIDQRQPLPDSAFDYDLRPVNPNTSGLLPIIGYTQPSELARKTMEEELSDLLPGLSLLTGREVTYLPHEKETKDSFGNVRIVFVSKTTDLQACSWRTSYKRGIVDCYISRITAGGKQYFDVILERHLYTAVDFTPYSMKQVYGYFFPNSRNEIELAICYIWQGHEEAMLRALVRECVVRSLGLPEAHFIKPDLLSLWNDLEKWERWQPKHKYFETRDLPEATSELSEMGELFIRLLYHPSIEPGMGYSEVLRAVTGF